MVGELGLTVEEVDKLTGPVIGRPKSAYLQDSRCGRTGYPGTCGQWNS